MSDATRAWAYRPGHSARLRRGTVVWVIASVLRLAVLMALLLAVFAGLTAGVGYVVVHHLAGSVTGR
jgi:hypothetical protein